MNNLSIVNFQIEAEAELKFDWLINFSLTTKIY